MIGVIDLYQCYRLAQDRENSLASRTMNNVCSGAHIMQEDHLVSWRVRPDGTFKEHVRTFFDAGWNQTHSHTQTRKRYVCDEKYMSNII